MVTTATAPVSSPLLLFLWPTPIPLLLLCIEDLFIPPANAALTAAAAAEAAAMAVAADIGTVLELQPGVIEDEEAEDASKELLGEARLAESSAAAAAAAAVAAAEDDDDDDDDKATRLAAISVPLSSVTPASLLLLPLLLLPCKSGGRSC